ncbi:HAMP domain-containing sensor histidine kinase [uncultured Flavobacterium sp.]|uniref:sensor histidine kinase n=1 Tax=uncultured Flavobacterium sp. TaxID=165435 RepID=UPI0025EDFFA2|nr:HAMP domain-containing sensor histidine kinase [uncultured Flavobacterium sp.]
MSALSFRNRIATYYALSTAALVLVLLFVIVLIVRNGVYQDIDNDLQTEIDDLLTEITVTGEGFSVEQEEWYEKEHNTLGINPIFIQFTDSDGRYFDRSPNLKNSVLHFDRSGEDSAFYDSTLDSIQVRQASIPVYFKERIVGYIIVAAPLEDAQSVITSLERTLLVAYPILLFVLFIIARLLAGGSIRPVKMIIDTAQKISHDSLSDRIPYPKHRDELYQLSDTINKLLVRIDNAVMREKEFTSNASHELRTPLAVIKGTLEVLVRKPRSQDEFIEKINYCIAELDRINLLVDQLLLLARFESQKRALVIESININTIILEVVARSSESLSEKSISLDSSIEPDLSIEADPYLLSVALENILSNAIKYSENGGSIKISCSSRDNLSFIKITDSGMGIAYEEMEKIVLPFYRSRPEEHLQINGSGIGLSIVKRICELLSIKLTIKSRLAIGTEVLLEFRTPAPQNQN